MAVPLSQTQQAAPAQSTAPAQQSYTAAPAATPAPASQPAAQPQNEALQNLRDIREGVDTGKDIIKGVKDIGEMLK